MNEELTCLLSSVCRMKKKQSWREDRRPRVARPQFDQSNEGRALAGGARSQGRAKCFYPHKERKRFRSQVSGWGEQNGEDKERDRREKEARRRVLWISRQPFVLVRWQRSTP